MYFLLDFIIYEQQQMAVGIFFNEIERKTNLRFCSWQKKMCEPPRRNNPIFLRFLYVWASRFDKWISSDLLIICVRDENIEGYRAMGRSVDGQQVDLPCYSINMLNCLLIIMYRLLIKSKLV
jgi:hypothetical protein